MRTSLPGDLGEAARKLRRHGARGTAAKLVEQLGRRLAADPGFAAHLRAGDLADSASLSLEKGRVVTGPATIGWVCAPAGRGSGGHTTLFRMLEGTRTRGHRSVVFLYDAWGGDVERHASSMRESWPVLADVEFRDARSGIGGVDASIASSWESAHALARFGTAPQHRFYFVQDFEPFFHPHGSIYAAAEDSYRFGFTHLALGLAVEAMLKTEVGATSRVVPFGCDTDTYGLRDPGAHRQGVVFFSRPGVPRRGFHLAVQALEEMHRRRPDHEIHMFGDPAPGLPFPVTDHGKLTPVQLDRLYNRTVTGLGLSFTNVTLVVEEMLASGCVPVVNRSPHTRLDNDQVVWADPTPRALADALVALLDETPAEGRERSIKAAASVRTRWTDSQRVFCDLVEDELGTAGAP